MRNTKEYAAWNQMRQRCRNPGHQLYPRYGARGISVCQRWENFENFYEDMGPRPSPGHSLDRYPDKNGNYEPGNVRWATRVEQQNNLNSNFIVRYRNSDMTFTQAWRLAGCVVRKVTAQARVYKGWSITEAVETPVGVRTRWSEAA